MQVTVITAPDTATTQIHLVDKKDTDLSKPGNCRWLIGHLKWAAQNKRVVTIAPYREPKFTVL